MVNVFSATVKQNAGSKIERQLPARIKVVKAILVSAPEKVELSLYIDGKALMHRVEFATKEKDGELGGNGCVHELVFPIGKGRLTGMIRSRSGASQRVNIFLITYD